MWVLWDLCALGNPHLSSGLWSFLCSRTSRTDRKRPRPGMSFPRVLRGRRSMTTEPKFIPKEAAELELAEGIRAKVRLIDCVGFMVEGAAGHTENGEERLVKTPWYDYEIPFTQAAEIGTRKVIRDHSTIGIVVACDGSFGELPGMILRRRRSRRSRS